MNTVPYSLELWDERFVEATKTQPARWDEYRVVFLGGDSMDYPGKAYDIRFTKDVYGELKLEFSIDCVFTNTIGGESEKNYLVDYLFNEVKIKLQYDGEWYDFVLKDITETHNQTFTLNCSCISLASSELSKIGYELKFSLDDTTGSAVQDAHSFMDAILEDTEWNYVEAGTQDVVQNLKVDLTESIEEVAYLLPVKEKISLYNFTIIDGILIKDENKISYDSGYLFIPYSALNSNEEFFAFYTPTETFSAVDEYYISKDQLQLVTITNKTGITPTEYTIEIPKKNTYTEYILFNDYENINNSINQYCKKMEYDRQNVNGEETEKIGYYREITRTPDYQYKKTNDPEPCYRYITEAGIAAGIVGREKVLDWWYPLVENADLSDDTIPHTNYRFIVNQFIPANSYLDFCVKDDVGILAIDGNWDAPLTAVTISDSEVNNKITGTKRYYYTREQNVNGSFFYREWTNLSSFISDDVKDFTFYEMAFDTKATIEETVDSVYTINQFFEVTRDNSKDIIGINILGYGNTGEAFFYQEDEQGTFVYNSVTGKYSEGTGSPKYKRVYYYPIETYNMYRTIQAEKSNCFNLTQTVAETFETWCRYIIEHDENGHISIDNEGRRKKWVTLTSSYGKVNEVGFTYGLNAKSISRNVQTGELVTKLYVDYCENNVAEDGFISIQLAKDNPSREGYLFNFDYFIHKKLLDAREVKFDLYNMIGEEPFDIIEGKSYIAGNKKAPGFLVHLGLLNQKYDSIQDTQLGTGEDSLTNQLVRYKTELEAYRVAIHTSTGSISDSRENDKKRYQELVRLVQDTEAKINEQYGEIERITARKKKLIREFNTKYARFIYEGNWSDSSYINHDSYYADALKVSSDAAKPSLSYDVLIENLRIAEGDGYELFNYEVGDETWVEDEEYFGYYADGRPYHEAVIVTEIVYQLDNQLNTQITIANHSNRFEDLFQRLSATAQSYSINQQTYNRASNLTSTGALKYLSLQSSFDENKKLTLINNNLVTTDDQGITVRNAANQNEIVRMISGGIVLSDDGGQTYTTGITAKGINTSLLSAGQINTENIRVVSTGSTGVIEIGGSELRMFSVDGTNVDNFKAVPLDWAADNKKVYYIKEGNEFISADTSRGFKKDINGNPIQYYEYMVSPNSELYFSPTVGIQFRHGGAVKFELNREGDLTATDLHLRGGDIDLTDEGRTINIGEILTEGSKILIHNSAQNIEEDDARLSAKYGSYGLELWHNDMKELTMYSSAINDGATIDLYGPGSEFSVSSGSYENASSGSQIKISSYQISFIGETNGEPDEAYLNYDIVKKIPVVYASTSAPENTTGKNGDIWIQY